MMQKRINPDMLTIARESRGFSQSELSRLLSVSQGRISKLESGLSETIPVTLLTKLSKILDYPEHFFTAKEQIYGVGMHLIYHRKRKSISSKALNKIQAQVNIFQLHISRLLQSVNLNKEFTLQYDVEEYGSIKEIAQAVKACWQVPRGPIKNITTLIENAGGIVVHCDFETRFLDAVSLWPGSMPPLFFVNSNVPGDKLRFSLAHELGHIIMHRIPNPHMEDQANEFAAEFLMPSDEIASQLNSLALPKLANLKLYWKVAMSALIMRAKGLKKITERQATYLFTQMSMSGYRTREPNELDIPIEKPHVLNQIFDFFEKKLKYSCEDLCQLLAINLDDFNLLYIRESEKPHLSIVK